jgi:hypothetical protein
MQNQHSYPQSRRFFSFYRQLVIVINLTSEKQVGCGISPLTRIEDGVFGSGLVDADPGFDIARRLAQWPALVCACAMHKETSTS